MYRDYTEATFDELKRQIEEINDSDFSVITDALGDLWYTFQSWIGTLKIDNYLEDVSSYHRKVLDQHNTSITDLERIFNAVHAVDENYSAKVGEINATMETYCRFLLQMTELINPTAFGFTASSVRTQMDAMSQEMTDATNRLNEIYDESLTMREEQIAKDAALDLISDLLSVPIHLFSFIADVAKGDWASAATDVWGVINDVFSTGGDLCALGAIGIGKCISRAQGGNLSARLYTIGEASEMQEGNGLASVLKAEGVSEQQVMVVEGVDIASDVIGFANTAKGFVENADEAARLLGSETLSGSTKWGYIKELLLQDSGFSFVDYSDETIIGWAKNNKGVYKNLKNIYEWAKAYSEDTTTEQLISGFDIPGIAEKAKNIVDDSFEWGQSNSEFFSRVADTIADDALEWAQPWLYKIA